jgi:HSP20 family protein
MAKAVYFSPAIAVFCFRPNGAERHNCAKDLKISCNPAPMSIVFSVSYGYKVVNLDNGARNGYIIYTSREAAHFPFSIVRVSAMPRFSGKKQYHREIVSRQVGEIKSLLHALEMRDGLDGAENRPLVDIYETGDGIILEFDLPGFPLADISLKVSGFTLVLEAFKPREANEGRFICVERSYGHFHHAVHIPGNIDPCSITAEYRRGVLRVMCPKICDRLVPIKEITIE